MRNISVKKLAIRIAPNKVTRVEETPAMTQNLLKALVYNTHFEMCFIFLFCLQLPPLTLKTTMALNFR
jgi:hypothetical protein